MIAISSAVGATDFVIAALRRVLAQYVAMFHPRLIRLAGTRDEVRTLATVCERPGRFGCPVEPVFQPGAHDPVGDFAGGQIEQNGAWRRNGTS